MNIRICHKPKYNIDVESLLSTPGKVHVYWKNENGLYLGCNDLSAERANLSSRTEIIGISDCDIPYNVWHLAKLQDIEVMHSKETKYFFNTATYNNFPDFIDYFTIKSPLFNQDNKLVGVFGISYYLSETDTKNKLAALLCSDISVETSKIHNALSNIHAGKELCLSKRQAECLFYLVRGMTYKQIANVIGLSHKTVEHHIQTLKIKLNCKNKSQLVTEALHLDFIKKNLIP